MKISAFIVNEGKCIIMPDIETPKDALQVGDTLRISADTFKVLKREWVLAEHTNEWGGNEQVVASIIGCMLTVEAQRYVSSRTGPE